MNEASKAILLTPPGPAAIAVVRLVGARVRPFLSAHFSRPAREGHCVHGTLADGRRVIDDPVVVLHAGGGAADVNLHGGPWVVRSVLELARREGFEVVDRPQFPLPEDSVDAETRLGREVLQYLPLARTELAARALLAQEAAWSAPPDAKAIPAILADRSLHRLLYPPRVAIVGPPNVGKSSLANQLFAQERSITADVPGTTRDWVGEIANLDGLAVMLVDTPGLRETADEIEREAIERARGQVEGADLLVLVSDPTQEARLPIDPYDGAVRVLNKADLVRGGDRSTLTADVHTVATTGEGVDELRRRIREHFLGTATYETSQARWWTPRQRALLERAALDPSALYEL